MSGLARALSGGGPSPHRALVLGIGGGGDVVGAIAVARTLESAGLETEVGGVSWERFAIDPYPGPRPLAELRGIERLGSAGAALCGPEGRTPGGIRICEAGVAAHLGRRTVLIDACAGPPAIAIAITAAADRLDCGLVVLADVGGDVLATGAEPGLASPLCDALLLAAGSLLPERLTVSGCVFGAGCDGELTIAEVLARIAAVAASGAWLATSSPAAEHARELIAVAASVPTEASLQAARSALGEVGSASIRGGRRIVELSPVAALQFHLDARAMVGPLAPLAAAVGDAESLEEARATLEALGVRTELDYELERAATDGEGGTGA